MPCIQVYDPNGKFIHVEQHPSPGRHFPIRNNFFIGELNDIGGGRCACGPSREYLQSPRHLHTRIGEREEGEGPTQFIAPHGVAVDSRGDLYVGDEAYTIPWQRMIPQTSEMLSSICQVRGKTHGGE